MTDIQLIEHLIARDERVTKQFFFEDCRPLFMSIVHNIFHEKADFDELISELYLHLMEDDARRLRQFQGRSSIYQWIKTVAIRFFLEKRDQMIEKESEEHLLEQAADDELIEMLEETLPEGIPHVFISSVTGLGVSVLKDILWNELNKENFQTELSKESLVHRAKDMNKLQDELRAMGQDDDITIEYEDIDEMEDFEYEFDDDFEFDDADAE